MVVYTTVYNNFLDIPWLNLGIRESKTLMLTSSKEMWPQQAHTTQLVSAHYSMHTNFLIKHPVLQTYLGCTHRPISSGSTTIYNNFLDIPWLTWVSGNLRLLMLTDRKKLWQNDNTQQQKQLVCNCVLIARFSA